MAIYKQVSEMLLQPYQYLAINGGEAKHDTPKEELASDPLGNPNVAFAALQKVKNRLVYTSGDDVGLMSDDEFARAFFASDPSSVQRMVDNGSLVELERESAPSEDSDEESAPEPAINASPSARREAQKRGVALENIEGTGNDGQITLNDVKAAKENPKDDELVRTWEEE